MLEIANHTPFLAAIAPSLDRDGVDWAHVVVKGTYDLAGKGPPPVAAEQASIVEAPVCHGEPGKSSVRYDTDLGPAKTGTDVVLVGHAWARDGRARQADVGLQVGPVQKVLRVFGDRVWTRAVLTWVASPPLEFDRIPLVWERAYGGRDATNPAKIGFEARNPVGTGFAAKATKERLEGLALPNLEDVRTPITSWSTRPPPVSFGFTGPDWEPRRRLAGTYDEAWKRDRFPLLPADFDPAFHSAAPADLQARPHLVGGEQAVVVGATPEGRLAFALPREALRVTAWVRGEPVKPHPVLDTVVIEPDEQRVMLTWRASFPCPRRFMQIEAVLVERERAR